jgi:hypothetical protein
MDHNLDKKFSRYFVLKFWIQKLKGNLLHPPSPYPLSHVYPHKSTLKSGVQLNEKRSTLTLLPEYNRVSFESTKKNT